MTNPAWKQEERKVGRALSGERNPLSGSNSRHTAGDVIQTPYYVDCKLSGDQNSTGERYHTLERATIEEVREGIEDEGKDQGFMTVRFKHCSDRYAILPWGVWEELASGELEDEIGMGNTMGHRAGGSKTTRIYRDKLKNLSHIHSGGTYLACYLWWAGETDRSTNCDAVIITWHSLLWLLGILWLCPNQCRWMAQHSADPGPECPECGSIMEVREG